MTKLIQKGNTKLGKEMYMWNMTTSIVQCNRTCKGCYSAREEARWPNVAKARQMRYEASLQPDFVSRIKSELSALKTKPKYFRVHASSEFYSQPYVDSWYRIASAFLDITFFAYTKRKKDFNFKNLEALPNFILIDSFHFGRVNYSTLDKAPTNAFICPDQKGATDVQCGTTCTWCMTKGCADTQGVFFVRH
jgi:hypothetical protein